MVRESCINAARRPLWRIVCWLPLVAGCNSAVPPTPEQPAAKPVSPEAIILRSAGKLELISPVYTVDRVYRSMTGPWSRTDIRLLEAPQPELLWITGCRVEMVDEQAAHVMPDQFMCHVNLDLDVEQHKRLFGMKEYRDERLFTLSQGQLEIRFPEGLGVPVRSDEALAVNTQVLNLNWPGKTFKVRHHVTIDFVRDRDLPHPYRPLVQSGVVGMVSLEGREVAFDINESLHGKCTSCCAPGKKAVDWAEGLDNYAHRFSNHWVVKPGRSEYRTRATSTLNLTGDNTVRYIAVHVHPFAESLELRDVTANQSIFTSRVRNLPGLVGLERVDFLSSPAGVPVTAEHEYELVATYNNTTPEDQDSMAIMFVYLDDKEFQRPE